MPKQYYIYIITNQNKSTLYIGVSNNLKRRIYEHKNELFEGFSKKYKLKMLVYYEICDEINEAIKREKYLKGKKREVKLQLINAFNPEWKDLYDEI